MVGILQGDTGAFCHNCTVSRQNGNNPLHIADGFLINKNYETCQEAWNLVDDSERPLPSNDRWPVPRTNSKSQLILLFCYAL